MREQCFDEGTIQAFLDGELASEMLEQVARHFALCDDCALLLQDAEEESAFAFSILDQEFDALVPTERIRTNLYQAISQIEEPKVSLWQRVFSFRFSLLNPSVVAFASLLIVAGIFATVMISRNQSTLPKNDDVAVIQPTVEFVPTIVPLIPPTGSEPTIQKATRPRVENIVYKPETKVQKPIVKDQKPNSEAPKETESLEGEDTYLKTIATLENTVNAKKDNVLRASSRISYERDMAVIDNSIKRMKAEVRKNPKNEAAKQILRNSYQNKIELLNSVSERSELMASLD